MISLDLVDSDDLDYTEYCSIQKEAFADVLASTKVSDCFMTPEYYRWKYHPPEGKGRIVLVRDNGKIVSCKAMIPLASSIKDEKILCWHSVDACVLPNARGSRYYQQSLNICKKALNNNEFLIGFPNRNSIKSIKREGFREICIVTTWLKLIPFFSAERSSNNLEIPNFGEEQDLFSLELENRCNLMLNRCSRYMNWRYVENPENKYSIFINYKDKIQQGCVVVRTANVLDRNITIIMELLALNKYAERELLKHVSWWAGEQKSRIIVLLDNKLPLRNGLNTGFMPVWYRFLPKTQVLMFHTPQEAFAEKIIESRWRIQTGDWDSF